MADLKNLNENMFKILEFSLFMDDSGPIPVWFSPKTLDKDSQMNIAMKSISLLMGESVYQFSFEFENIKYFGILPFPSLNMVGLTYFFLIKDENSRGKARAATITALLDSKDEDFIYENVKILRILIDKTSQLLTKDQEEDEISFLMNKLMEEMQTLLPVHASEKNVNKDIKFMFLGLDNSGKTSFLKSIEQRYSEVMGNRRTPTKFIERSKKDVLDTSVHKWDFGGQLSYRKSYLKNAGIYLGDSDILFFIIDSQDSTREKESLEYLDNILKTLEDLQDNPPVMIIFHKSDPDLKEQSEYSEYLKKMEMNIRDSHNNWELNFSHTSIFDYGSIISAFSYGMFLLNPEKDKFKDHLKWLTEQSDCFSAYLFMKNAIVLGEYSLDQTYNDFIIESHDNMLNLFSKFKQFNLIHEDMDSITWEINNDVHIIFRKFDIQGQEFFLILSMGKSKKISDNLDNVIADFIKKIDPIIKKYF